jgi:hypothetical protein
MGVVDRPTMALRVPAPTTCGRPGPEALLTVVRTVGHIQSQRSIGPRL